MNLLASINWQSFGIVILILAVVSLVFTILILLVNKLCAVKEDPRISEVSDNLAGANCGGCGYAGCADFAKAVVEGRASVNDCSATSSENKKKIASILGVEVEDLGPMVAVVKCMGTNDDTTNKFDYVGGKTCQMQNLVAGGSKLCPSSCLGGGDCAKACTEQGVTIENGLSKTDRSSCIGCGACVRACPKNIIELIPRSAKVYIACSSKCKGKDVLNACKKGCIGCGLCAKNCPENAITMADNLPVIDYKKCVSCGVCADKCPRKCIVKI